MDMSNLIGLAKNLNAALVDEQKLATQLPTVLPNQTYLVEGVTMTCAEVVAQVEQHIRAEQQLASLKAQLKEVQLTIKDVRSRTSTTLKVVKTTTGAALGTGSQKYQDLGFPAAKRRKTTTAAEKALAAERNVATREARGTKGSRQKAAIHGTVPAPAAAPTPSPATPAVVK
jgi:hypothetical protein